MTLYTSPPWGLRHDITPALVPAWSRRETACITWGDRAGLYGTFSAMQLRALDRSFPAFIRRMESALRSGELDPHKAHTLRRQKEGLICEADTRGSCGYVYVSVYPAPQPA